VEWVWRYAAAMCAVPAPGTIAVLGLAGLLGARRRRAEAEEEQKTDCGAGFVTT
jgi:hypothetical protein